MLRIGNIASGDDFFDREAELQDMWRYLQANHVLLAGPRRLGKSSLLKRLGEQAADHELLSAMVDVEGADTALGFIAAIESAFPDASMQARLLALGKRAVSAIPTVKKIDLRLPGGIGGGLELQTLADAPWGKRALDLQQRLSTKPLLILLDEFSVFLGDLIARDAREAEQLLGWLRAWRMSDTTCRFVFSGSVGINALLERHKLTTRMNDCQELRLQPFRPAAAIHMLTTLAGREAWPLPADVANYLCERTGWLSPFYLCLLLDETFKAGRDRRQENPQTDAGDAGEALQISDVDDAYDRLLAGRSRFIHWHARLKRDLAGTELDMALHILRLLSRAAGGLSTAQLSSRLTKHIADPQQRADALSASLNYLEDNGYVGQDTKRRVQFLSFLLHDYWKRNHGV